MPVSAGTDASYLKPESDQQGPLESPAPAHKKEKGQRCFRENKEKSELVMMADNQRNLKKKLWGLTQDRKRFLTDPK